MTDRGRPYDGRGTGSTGPAPVVASEEWQPPGTVPPPPAAAAVIFGDRLPLAERFAAILADTGTSHGLICPREVPILWERHILNCAVAQAAFPEGVRVVDVGSGAGLPGVVLAIARPDLHLDLVEPMLRRTTWLDASIEELGLRNCTVHRGRAEEFQGRLRVPFATARAVARIDRLARWTFPLLEAGGTLVALKGGQAAEELAAEEPTLRRLGMESARVVTYGAELLEVPTVSLELTVQASGSAGRNPSRPPKTGSASRRAGRGRAQPPRLPGTDETRG